MYEVEYVSDQYLARAAAYPGLLVFSRPVMIERRMCDRRLSPRPTVDRRHTDIEQLLRAAFPEYKVQYTTQPESRTMNEKPETAPVELIELATAIARLPAEHRAALRPLMSKVIDNATRRRRILTLVQDALGQLRLDVKYLVFDLEATRRERDAAKGIS